MNKKFWGEQEGFALVMVLMIILIWGIITSFLVVSSGINLKLARNIAINKKAIYTAEAGIEYGKCILFAEKELPPEKKTIYLDNKSYFIIQISKIDNSEKEYKLEVTGFYEGKSKKMSLNIKMD